MGMVSQMPVTSARKLLLTRFLTRVGAVRPSGTVMGMVSRTRTTHVPPHLLTRRLPVTAAQTPRSICRCVRGGATQWVPVTAKAKSTATTSPPPITE